MGRGADDGRDHSIAAYERVSSLYGWSPRAIEDHLTREQLFHYLEAADERLAFEADSAIETVRIGMIFANDAKSYRSWRARSRQRASQAMSAPALEAAVMGLAARNPEYVVMGA